MSALAFTAAFLVACGDEVPAERDPRPDIVVVMLDTLRPDHLPAFGYERATAPFLSELAAASVRFPRAFSTSSWTAPATASVFTGLYPPRHGVLEGLVAQNASKEKRDEGLARLDLSVLPAGVPTLPEALSASGYRSFGVAANINVGEAIGFSRGFDRYAYLVDEPAEVLVDQLARWQREIQRANPAFVYLHFNDTHEPYGERNPWFEEFRAELPANAPERLEVQARYDSEIAYLDAQLRRLFELFEWASAERDTVVIVISDHGEEFWEHGKLGHGYRLYDELNRVLFFVHAPDRFAARDVRANVSLVDLMPTLVDIAAREGEASSRAAGAERDGLSLLPLLRAAGAESEAAFANRSVYAHRFKSSRWWRKAPVPLWAVIEPRWKLIAQGDRSLLYDLERDPREQRNLSGREPGRVAAMRVQLDEFRRAATPAGDEKDRVQVEIDAETRRRLEVLGYVDAPDDDAHAGEPDVGAAHDDERAP